MKIGKTISTGTSPKRDIRKANEPRKDPRIEQPIPVEIPKRRKVKKEQEVESAQEWRFMYGWGARYVIQDPYINTGVS
jgi:hypothetical protein